MAWGKTLTGEAGEMGDASGGMYLDLSNMLKSVIFIWGWINEDGGQGQAGR